VLQNDTTDQAVGEAFFSRALATITVEALRARLTPLFMRTYS